MQLLAGHTGMVHAVAWSKGGDTIATGGADAQLILWDGTTFKELRRIHLGGRDGKGIVRAVAFSPDGQTVAAGVESGDGKNVTRVVLLDVATGQPVAQLARPWTRPVAALAFSPDGGTLIAASGPATAERPKGDVPHGLTVWERVRAAAPPPVEPAWKERPIPDAPAGYVWDVARSPDGKRFAAAGHVWDAATLKKLYPLPGAWPGFSADGSKLFAVGEKSIDVTDAATGKRLATKPMPKKTFAWHRVAFSPDGKRYAAFDGVEVRLFDLDTGFEPVRLDGQLSGMPGYISGSVAGTGLDWSPDGKRLLGFSWVKGSSLALLLWDAATGKVIRTFDANNWPGTKVKNPFGCPAERAAFSPDGKTLILGGNSRLLLLDAATFKLNREIEIQSRDGGGADITAVALSADGKYVAAGYKLRDGKSPYHRVGVWDAATGKQFDTPLPHWGQPGQEPPVAALAFVQGGKSLVIGVGLTSVATFNPHGKPLVIGAGLTSKAVYDAGGKPPKDAVGLHVWRLTAKE
jgi:WD40 repeat protein